MTTQPTTGNHADPETDTLLAVLPSLITDIRNGRRPNDTTIANTLEALKTLLTHYRLEHSTRTRELAASRKAYSDVLVDRECFIRERNAAWAHLAALRTPAALKAAAQAIDDLPGNIHDYINQGGHDHIVKTAITAALAAAQNPGARP